MDQMNAKGDGLKMIPVGENQFSKLIKRAATAAGLNSDHFTCTSIRASVATTMYGLGFSDAEVGDRLCFLHPSSIPHFGFSAV